MITCPICDYHYSENRSHCPTCGTIAKRNDGIYSAIYHQLAYPENGYAGMYMFLPIAMAHGAERARQLPQSPRVFQLVD